MCPGRNPLQFRDIKLVLIQTFVTTNSYFIQSYCHHLTCLIVLTQMRRFELLHRFPDLFAFKANLLNLLSTSALYYFMRIAKYIQGMFFCLHISLCILKILHFLNLNLTYPLDILMSLLYSLHLLHHHHSCLSLV